MKNIEFQESYSPKRDRNTKRQKNLPKQQKSAPNNKNLLQTAKIPSNVRNFRNFRFFTLDLTLGGPYSELRRSSKCLAASTGRDLMENIKFQESYNTKRDRNTKQLKYFLKQLKSAQTTKI